jgi:hypothetical protein
MNSYSKSIFTNSTVSSNTRSLIRPTSLTITAADVASSGGIVIDGGATTDVLDFLSTSYLNILRIIETQYGANMANKTYENIPSNYTNYTQLVSTLKIIQTKTTNSTLTLFLKLAEDTLVGSVNSYTLYGDNLLLQVDKSNLEKRVNDILTDKNTKLVENTFSYSNMSVQKTFKLAAVFNYYIMIYGLPVQGVGFDPVKISFLVDILTEKGINPYG